MFPDKYITNPFPIPRTVRKRNISVSYALDFYINVSRSREENMLYSTGEQGGFCCSGAQNKREQIINLPNKDSKNLSALIWHISKIKVT